MSTQNNLCKQFCAIGVATALCALSVTATAQLLGDRNVTNPRLLPEAPAGGVIQATTAASQKSLQRLQAGSATERVLNLNVVYTDAQLYNPATRRYDKVRLRSYNGTDVDPGTPYVAPSIEIAPGETVRVNLNNQLPQDPSCFSSSHSADDPHCFNGTNLHTHGLWINPAGNGDNVLLSINPGVKFEYEYNVPSDHPSGTFWYHTHRHGSTALQVSSGMAGALIIRGDRLPTQAANGDIDTILKDFAERTLVMQQIQYACRTPPTPEHPKGEIKQTDSGRYICDPGDVGVIEDYDQFGPGSWPASGRYTSINGHVLPTVNAEQGGIERWRLIHAGVRDTISLQFFKMRRDHSLTKLSSIKTEADEERLISDYCGTEPLPYTLIAADGLTLAQAQQTDIATFQPGYRYDALVVFPEAGEYCVIDASAPRGGTVNGLQVSRQLLGVVQASKGTKVEDVQQHITKALVARANKVMPNAIKPQIVAELENDLKFSHFVPHPDIAAAEVTGTQELTFFIDTSGPAATFEVANTLHSADAKPYDPNRLDRRLTLGSVDEWIMQSHFVSHPFHIHVNPFQVVEILDPNGKDVSARGTVDDAGGAIDPQYEGLKGVWKDTLWIKSLLPGTQKGIYTVKVRTRYQRYIGEFVLHCHILDHEDKGMMQNVAVVLPGSEAPEMTKHPQNHENATSEE